MTDIEKNRATKLVIRIKVNSDANGNNTVRLSSQENFRLTIETVSVVLAVALILSGLWYFFGNKTDNVVQVPAHSSISNVATKSAESVNVDSKNKILPEAGHETGSHIPADKAQTDLADKQEQTKKQAVKADDVIQKKAESIPPVVEPATTTIGSKSILDSSDALTKNTSAIEKSKQLEVKTSVHPNTDNNVNKPVKSLRLKNNTSNVTRMVFADGIRNREPINPIGKNISALNKGLRRIYCFTELHHLKGKTILHRWYFKDKLQAQIRFKVRGNRWRVNSSKRIVPTKQGLWRVDVVEQQTGKVLASNSFMYGK